MKPADKAAKAAANKSIKSTGGDISAAHSAAMKAYHGTEDWTRIPAVCSEMALYFARQAYHASR